MKLRIKILLVCGVVLALATALKAAEPQRPFWRFSGDPGELRDALKDWLRLSDGAIRKRARDYLPDRRDELNELAVRMISLAEAASEPDRRKQAATLLTVALDGLENIENELTAEGAANPRNLIARDAALSLGLRFHVTGEPVDAKRARLILLRLGELIPRWPLWDPDGNPHSQDEERFFARWDGRGLWRVWYHMDLVESFPLLRAYDLIWNELSPADRKIIRGLFMYHVELMRKWKPQYSNMMGHRLHGLARFGTVLPEPLCIHEMLDLYKDMVYISFFPDGFFREATPSYHTMPVGRMTNLIPRLVKGWSDPPGWSHPQTHERIDNLDLDREFAVHHARWWNAWDKLTLPNGRTLAVNDSTAGRRAWWTKRDLEHSEPRLLGTTGVAMLGHGEKDAQQQLYLLAVGTHGHEHHDALNIAWFAHGREVFSETNYRPIPKSDSTREWHTMSAGHNLVVIDEKDQPGRFGGIERRLNEDDAMRGMRDWHYRVRAMNYPRLVLFDGNWPEVQAMEADGERAYQPHAKLYRRTLALVPLEDGDGYVLDIFRVRGGVRHDYTLHGCLDEEYSFTFSGETDASDGKLFEYIELERQARAAPPCSFEFEYDDGLKTTTHVLSPAGGDAAQLLAGRAPAMRRLGHAPFVVLRHDGRPEPAETTFVLVHEAHKGKPVVVAAELLPVSSKDPHALAVRIELAGGREDVFLSTLGDGSIKLADGTRFHGRLGYIRHRAGPPTILHLFDGGELVLPSGEGIRAVKSFEGRVLSTKRIENGDPVDAIVVEGKLPGGDALAGRTIHVDMNGEIVWSYRIERVEPSADSSVVSIEHDPGFEIRKGGGLTKMVFYPGWGIQGKATYRIPRAAHWQAD